jgi:hypothetical protein
MTVACTNRIKAMQYIRCECEFVKIGIINDFVRTKMSLFGGMTSQSRSRNLVEFKAGKMNLRGNMVCYINFDASFYSLFSDYRSIQINEKVLFIYIKAMIRLCIYVGKIDQIILRKMIL